MKLVASRLISAFSLGLASLLVSFTAFAQAEPATIVVYNAQHESLTQAWADGFTKETGIKVTLRNGGDTRARQPDRPGRRRFAGRRVPDREFAGHGAGRQRRAVRPASTPATLAQVPEDFRPPDGQLDRHRGARRRCSPMTRRKLTRGQAAEVAAGSRRSELEGPLGRLAVGRRLPGDRQRAARAQGRGRDRRLAEGDEGERDGLSRQQRRDEGASTPARSKARVIYHYYYFGDQAKTGENSDNVALHYFRNQDPGAFVSDLRRRRAGLEQASGRRPRPS